jgi:hypothetical protein
MRSTGHSLANSVARVAAFAAPFLVNSGSPLMGIAVVLALVNLVSAMSSWLLPESKGKSLDDGDDENNPKPRAIRTDELGTDVADDDDDGGGGGGGGIDARAGARRPSDSLYPPLPRDDGDSGSAVAVLRVPAFLLGAGGEGNGGGSSSSSSSRRRAHPGGTGPGAADDDEDEDKTGMIEIELT